MMEQLATGNILTAVALAKVVGIGTLNKRFIRGEQSV